MSNDHWQRVAQQAGKLQRRTAKVAVPALAWMFPEGEEPAWVVRNLSSNEFWFCNEAADRDKRLIEIVRAVSAGQEAEADLAEALNLYGKDGVHPEIRKRLALVELGTVTPEIPEGQKHDVVVMLAEHHTNEFFAISSKVLELTTGGSETGKPKGSTQKKASG